MLNYEIYREFLAMSIWGTVALTLFLVMILIFVQLKNKNKSSFVSSLILYLFSIMLVYSFAFINIHKTIGENCAVIWCGISYEWIIIALLSLVSTFYLLATCFLEFFWTVKKNG